MSIKANLLEIKRQLPAGVRLVAVSKFHPAEAIQEAYGAGQRIFGENKAQELAAKAAALPRDIEWHFIGHLQTNKVKHVVPHVSLIHGVDSLRLLAEINREAAKAGCVTDCLLQVHIAQEETKFGFSYEELEAMLAAGEWRSLANVRIVGLMAMASLTGDHEQVRREFRSLAQFFRSAKENHFQSNDYFKELSMGMSGDYPVAVEEGSTLVRIGSAIFEAPQPLPPAPSPQGRGSGSLTNNSVTHNQAPPLGVGGAVKPLNH